VPSVGSAPPFDNLAEKSVFEDEVIASEGAVCLNVGPTLRFSALAMLMIDARFRINIYDLQCVNNIAFLKNHHVWIT